MPKDQPLALSVALTCTGRATLRQPDCVHLVVDAPLLARISKSLAALSALNIAGARITLPFDASATFTGKGSPWPMEDRKDACFVVLSLQLHVEPNGLHIEVREVYDEDVLHGAIEFRDQPALREALRRQWRESVEETGEATHG